MFATLKDVFATLKEEKECPLKAIDVCLPDNRRRKRPPEGRLQQTQPTFDWHKHDAAALGIVHCKVSAGRHEYVLHHLHPVD